MTPTSSPAAAGPVLWPLSTPDRPKPFLPLLGERSLLQLTANRLVGLVDADAVFVVADSDRHGDLVRAQLPATTVVETAWAATRRPPSPLRRRRRSSRPLTRSRRPAAGRRRFAGRAVFGDVPGRSGRAGGWSVRFSGAQLVTLGIRSRVLDRLRLPHSRRRLSAESQAHRLSAAAVPGEARPETARRLPGALAKVVHRSAGLRIRTWRAEPTSIRRAAAAPRPGRRSVANRRVTASPCHAGAGHAGSRRGTRRRPAARRGGIRRGPSGHPAARRPAASRAARELVLHATRSGTRHLWSRLQGGSLTSLAGFNDGHRASRVVVEPREFASLDDILGRATSGTSRRSARARFLETARHVGSPLLRQSMPRPPGSTASSSRPAAEHR